MSSDPVSRVSTLTDGQKIASMICLGHEPVFHKMLVREGPWCLLCGQYAMNAIKRGVCAGPRR